MRVTIEDPRRGLPRPRGGCVWFTTAFAYMICAAGLSAQLPGTCTPNDISQPPPAPAWQSAVALDVGAFPLYRVTSAALLDSLVVVGNAGSGEVVVFSVHDGHFLRSIGGLGNGPSEFRQLGRVHIDTDDHIVVADAGTQSIKRFSLRDGSVSTARYQGLEPLLDVQPFGDDRNYLALLGLEGDRIRALRPNAGPVRPLVPLLVLDASGLVRDTLTQVPSREYALTSTPGAGFSIFEPPFARRTLIEVVGDCALVARGDDATIDVLAVKDDVSSSIRVEGVESELAEDEWERRLLAIESGAEGPGAQSSLREILQTLDRPTVRPAFSGMLYDQRSRLWLEAFHHFDEEAPGWWVLDIIGHEWTWVGAPQQVRRLLAVARDRLVLLYVDELGTETITLVPL